MRHRRPRDRPVNTAPTRSLPRDQDDREIVRRLLQRKRSLPRPAGTLTQRNIAPAEHTRTDRREPTRLPSGTTTPRRNMRPAVPARRPLQRQTLDSPDRASAHPKTRAPRHRDRPLRASAARRYSILLARVARALARSQYLAVHRAPADPSHTRGMPAPARAVDRPPAPGRMHALPTPTPSHRPARRRTAPNGPPAEPRLALPARRAPPAPAPHSRQMRAPGADDLPDRKSTRLNSSHVRISYAV